eukprot:1140770-Pelagomonas_calceolata.AAC.4
MVTIRGSQITLLTSDRRKRAHSSIHPLTIFTPKTMLCNFYILFCIYRHPAYIKQGQVREASQAALKKWRSQSFLTQREEALTCLGQHTTFLQQTTPCPSMLACVIECAPRKLLLSFIVYCRLFLGNQQQTIHQGLSHLHMAGGAGLLHIASATTVPSPLYSRSNSHHRSNVN